MIILNAETIGKLYTDGLWTKEQVKGAVTMTKISPDEYKTITGEDYVA